MSAIKLHVLEAEREQHDGARFRARREAGFHRGRRLGKDPLGRVPGEESGPPDADGRSRRSAQGRGVGKLRHHAVSVQQARPRPLLSQGAGRARDDRQRDVLYHRHALSPTSRARPIPRSASRNIPARSARATPTRAPRTRRRKPPPRRSPSRSRCSTSSTWAASRSSAAAEPSIADIRLAATLEFLAVIDYPLPPWAKQYMAAMEKSLGAAYAEPAADVRGYIAHMKSQKK